MILSRAMRVSGATTKNRLHPGRTRPEMVMYHGLWRFAARDVTNRCHAAIQDCRPPLLEHAYLTLTSPAHSARAVAAPPRPARLDPDVVRVLVFSALAGRSRRPSRDTGIHRRTANPFCLSLALNFTIGCDGAWSLYARDATYGPAIFCLSLRSNLLNENSEKIDKTTVRINKYLYAWLFLFGYGVCCHCGCSVMIAHTPGRVSLFSLAVLLGWRGHIWKICRRSALHLLDGGLIVMLDTFQPLFRCRYCRRTGYFPIRCV